MIDQRLGSPVGADTWKVNSQERHKPTPSPHVAYRQVGESGATRLKLDLGTFYVPVDQRQPAEDGLGVASVESPLRPESFHQVQENPIFDASSISGSELR